MSLLELINVVTEFIKNHQNLAVVVIFLLAFAESLAIVSLLIPATALLLACGVLIGQDLVDFYSAFIAAIIGAILGDSLSYWLGKHYHFKIITMWPLKKYPNAIIKAENFFNRYGAMSVFIGRFFGPLRAFVPLIAGAMKMPSLKFNIGNIASAPIWAFFMFAPGAFGIRWLEFLFG